jgi:ribose/xylose/arabinose/galactoside ABC-type transport system permease subunit
LPNGRISAGDVSGLAGRSGGAVPLHGSLTMVSPEAPQQSTVTEVVAAPIERRVSERTSRILLWARNNMALVLLVVLVIAGALLSDVFLTPRNLLNIMWAVSILGVIALGQTMLLITCNFDMSVAFVVGLSGIVAVLSQIAGADLYTSMALGLSVGVAFGLLNGALVVITGANPFLITLGTSSLAYAISLMLTQSQTLYATAEGFTELGRGRLFGVVHYSVIIFIGLALLLQFVLSRAPYGRSLYVLGLNERAGKLSGLPVRVAKISTFVLCSVLAALAGLIMTSRTGSTVANAGVGMDFDSIIASVLGGISLFGGRGSALRAVVGVLVLGVLNNLLVLLSVPLEAQQIAKGTIFLLVVWADSALRQP